MVSVNHGVNRLVAFILVNCILHFQFAKGGGKLSLTFENYTNPSHDKDDKSFCASSAGASTARFDCENIFVLCISSSTDQQQQQQQQQQCNIMQYNSSIIKLDTISFEVNNRDRRLKSPFVYTFNKWNGTVKFDLKVYDRLPSSNTLITKFESVKKIPAINYTTHGSSFKTLTFISQSQSQPKHLMIKVSIMCDEYYLAPECRIKHCVPKDDDKTGHYNCTATGEKICLNGWENTTLNCLKKVCVPKNDDINGHFNCSKMGEKVCLDGWENTTLNCLKKKMCVPQNDNRNGHYECSDKGKKICLTGWDNITMNCSKRTCIPHDDDVNGHYKCSSNGEKVCLDGWLQSSNCTSKMKIPIVNPPTNFEEGKDSRNRLIFVLIPILILLVLLIVIIALVIYWKKKRKNSGKKWIQNVERVHRSYITINHKYSEAI